MRRDCLTVLFTVNWIQLGFNRDSIFQLMMDSKNWHAGMFKGIKSGPEIKRNGQQIANKELKEGMAFSPVLCPPLRVVQEKIRGHMTT